MKIRNIILAVSIAGLVAGFVYFYLLANTSDYNDRFGYYTENTLLWSEEVPKALIMIGASAVTFCIAKFVPLIIQNYIKEKRAFEEMKRQQILRRQMIRAKNHEELKEYNEFLQKYQGRYPIDDKDVKNI